MQENTEEKNEIDVAILYRNVLYVLECKTVNYNKQRDKARDALYKLETLKKRGGLRTQMAFISYRSLPQSVIDRATGACKNGHPHHGGERDHDCADDTHDRKGRHAVSLRGRLEGARSGPRSGLGSGVESGPA